MATQTGSLDLKAGKSASKTATEYITEIDSDGIFISPSSQDPTETSTGNSVRINGDGMEIFKGGVSVAMYGDSSRIGKDVAGTTRTIISPDGMQILRKSGTTDVQIANLGYGSGNTETGTATAPYYTLGRRKTDSNIGNYSVAEGQNTTASGYASHAEGKETVASGAYAHAEGDYTEATGFCAHAEGYKAIAIGEQSHAEGSTTTANGNYSYAGGWSSLARATGARATGARAYAYYEWQTVIGKANIVGDYAFIIGNGNPATADLTRSNAFMVDWDGYIYPQATKMTDFVVEQGTDGIWTYRKWNSGIAECWGRYSVTLTKYTTVGSFAGYYTTVSFPTDLFVAGSIPTHTYTATIGTGFAMPASGMNVSNTSMYVYALATASANNQSCVFDIIAKGRWK